MVSGAAPAYNLMPFGNKGWVFANHQCGGFMRNGMILAALAAAGLSGQALAQDGLSYSYLDVGYISTDLEDFDVDGDGFGLDGSIALTDKVHAVASYSDQEFDFGVDAKAYSVGAGLNWPLQQNLDLVGRLSYVKAELDAPGFSEFDDDGYGVEAGLRGLVGERFELGGTINYVDLNDSGDDTSFAVGGLYHLTNQFAFGLGADFGDDVTSWTAAFRVNFGK
jgi:hypothetical protein